MRKLVLGLALCAFAAPAGATVYFNPVPNTLVNGTTMNPTPVNANFASLITDGNAAQAAIQAMINALPAGTGVPSGAVIMVNNTVCPSGYQVANGSGGTPDARGAFVRGLDLGRGLDTGRTLASFQGDQLQAHTHVGSAAFGGLGTGNVNGGATFTVASAAYSAVGSATTTTVAGGAGTENRPNAIVLLHCAKL